MNMMNRRHAVATLGASALAALPNFASANEAPPKYEIAAFSADVTPPIGHPLIAGWRAPAKTIKERLHIRGIVLQPTKSLSTKTEMPIVFAAIDWCELRNDSYDRWREAIAKAAGTTRERVLLSSVHQHDAPYADITAQLLMNDVGMKGAMIDMAFHEACVKRTAEAITHSLAKTVGASHFSVGEAKVEKIACNRRVELEGRPPRFNRGSYTREPEIRSAADGEIDPYVKSLTFWRNEKAVATISTYATHPMSYYGRGEVSHDFVGMAREIRQRANPDAFQIYMSGCSGDVTAAKYNDGEEAGRIVLAQRLADGMKAATLAAKKHPLTELTFRSTALNFEPETAGKLDPRVLRKTLANEKASHLARSTAALGLSWQKRVEAEQPIDLPVVDFGACKFLLLPAEAFVAYQIAAQKMLPDSFVMTVGFGECAPGYIPTAKTRKEGFVREHGYCWVASGAEATLLAAMRKALGSQ